MKQQSPRGRAVDTQPGYFPAPHLQVILPGEDPLDAIGLQPPDNSCGEMSHEAPGPAVACHGPAHGGEPLSRYTQGDSQLLLPHDNRPATCGPPVHGHSQGAAGIQVQLVAGILEDEGHETRLARDSDEALQFYRVKNALERSGIQLIVEKIEEEEQLVDLLDHGINLGQGYLFGTPRLSRDI